MWILRVQKYVLNNDVVCLLSQHLLNIPSEGMQYTYLDVKLIK